MLLSMLYSTHPRIRVHSTVVPRVCVSVRPYVWLPVCSGRFRGAQGARPPFGKKNVKGPHQRLLLPPPLNRVGFRRPPKNSATTPPPLNRVGFRRPRKNSATTPPPLNRVDLAAPLGKSWICDWSVYESFCTCMCKCLSAFQSVWPYKRPPPINPSIHPSILPP